MGWNALFTIASVHHARVPVNPYLGKWGMENEENGNPTHTHTHTRALKQTHRRAENGRRSKQQSTSGRERQNVVQGGSLECLVSWSGRTRYGVCGIVKNGNKIMQGKENPFHRRARTRTRRASTGPYKLLHPQYTSSSAFRAAQKTWCHRAIGARTPR